ncbi:hypothetical protein [Aliivibrio sp. EL58]
MASCHHGFCSGCISKPWYNLSTDS